MHMMMLKLNTLGWMVTVAVTTWLVTTNAVAQLIPQPILPIEHAPEPVVPTRDQELINWVGIPRGDDIAIIALDFQPSLLPGMTVQEMSGIYSAASNGNSAENPLAQLIAAVQQGQKSELNRLVAQLLASARKDSPEVHFLAGLWAESTLADSAKAIEWFLSAKKLMQSDADKLFVDRYILGSAVLANPGETALRREGIAAALRLADSFWNNSSGTARSLGSILADFGEKEAAAKVVANAKKDSGDTPANAEVRNSNRNSATYRDVVNAFAAGDRDGGLEMAVEGVKQAVTSFSQSGSLDNMSYRYRQMVQFVAAYGLTGPVLAAVDPGNDSAVADQVNYAIACELLNKLDLALPEYKRILAENPDQHAVRWRLIVNSVGEPRAQELLKDFPQKNLQQYGSTLSNLLQNQRDFFERLELVELIQFFLDTLEPDLTGNLSWATNVLSPLTGEFYSDDIRVMGVHQTSGGYGFQDAAQEKRSEEAAKMRAALHAKLCESMLRHPSLATAGFASLSGFAGLPERRTEQELIALARKILSSEYSPDQSFYYSHPTSSNQLPQLTPAQYLFKQAVDNGSMKVIDTEIVPVLEKLGKTQMAASLKAFSGLYSCTSEDYFAVASAIVEKGVEGINSDTMINYVQSAARQRGFETDLVPLVLSVVRSMRDLSSSVPYSATNYVTSIYNSGGAPVTRSFIDAVSEIYLGPLEGQPAFVAKHFSGGYQQGKPSGHAYTFKEFLERLSSPMGVTMLAVDKYLNCGYAAINDSDMANRFENSVRRTRFDDSYPATFQMLDESPWLKSVEDFQVWPMRHISAGSCYAHLITQMRQSSSIRKRMLEHVESSKPETFGKNLMLACFESDPSAGVNRVLAKHLEKLEKLPIPRQKEMIAWYQTFISSQGRANRSSSQSRAVSAWIKRATAPPVVATGQNKVQPDGTDVADNGQSTPAVPTLPVSALAETFLAAKNPAEASQKAVLHQHVIPVLVSVSEDPAACAKVFAHYKKLAAMPQVYTTGRSSGEDSYDSQLLAAFISQVDPSRSARGASFAPLVAIFDSEAGRVTIPGSQLISTLATTYAATRSDVSPGVRVVLEQQATPKMDEVAALLLTASAPYRLGGKTVYGMRLNGLAELAAKNGWVQTATVLQGESAEEFSELVLLESAPVGLRLLAASAMPMQSVKSIEALVELVLAAFEQGAVLPADVSCSVIESFISNTQQQPEPEWKLKARQLLHGTVQSLPQGSQLTADQFMVLLHAAEKIGYSSRRVQMRFGMNFGQQPWFLAMLVKHRQFAAARQHLKSQLPQMQLPQIPTASGAPAIPTGNVISRSTSNRSDGTRRITEEFESGQEVTYIEDQFGNRTVENNSNGNGNTSPVTFDSQLAAAIPDFVQTIEDPGLQGLAELILLATPDADKESKVGESGVRQRMIAVASRVANTAVENPFIEERILSLLAPVALESIGLRERIDRYGRDVDVVALAMFEDESIKKPRERIFKAYLDAALVHQPEAFAEMMGSLLISSTSRDYRVVRALKFYGSSFPDVLFQSSDGFSQAKANRYISVFQKLLEVGGNNSEWAKRLDCLNGAIICHVMAGKSEQFAQWFTTLEPALQSTFRSQIQLRRLLQLVSKPLSSSDLSEEAKVAVLGSLMEAKIFPVDPDSNEETGNATQALQGGGSELFESLLDEGVLTAAALIEHGPRWAKMNPRNGAAWAEIAAIQAKAGKNQWALESWTQAVMAVPWDNRKNYSEYHLAAAKLMLKMNRLEPALTWFEFFNRGRLFDDSELEFDTLFRDTRYKVMMRQGRIQELLTDAVSSLELNSSDTAAWQQLGSVFDALGRRKLADGETREAVPMLECALILLSKASAENPALGKGQVDDVFESLVDARIAIGEMGNSVSLIPKLSEWRYFYSVEAPDSWAQGDFNDSDWKSGVGQLGYGDDDEATVLKWGNDPDDKPITAYFRKKFDVQDLAQINLLAIDLVRDDGAVVYLNGKEVRRDNMPEGKINFSTEAPKSPKKSEENRYLRSTIPPDFLQPGDNVIAVEVHQNDPDSSDLSFDLQLLTNALSMEESLRAIKIENLREQLEQNATVPALSDALWKMMDQSRQLRQPMLPNSIQILNSETLLESPGKNLLSPFSRPSVSPRSRRVVLPPVR
ncbi:MAG: tetratricopeptide (TPR) repeat protein [Verrucomicrobiales bacterium]|jgi:tetratricopeptide (TPR) repeat protein